MVEDTKETNVTVNTPSRRYICTMTQLAQDSGALLTTYATTFIHGSSLWVLTLKDGYQTVALMTKLLHFAHYLVSSPQLCILLNSLSFTHDRTVKFLKPL
jgi:hypothetical protein